MIHVKGIDWQPIEAITFGKKDGNDLLLWDGESAEVGYWSDSGPSAATWVDHYGETIEPTHWADINPPA